MPENDIRGVLNDLHRAVLSAPPAVAADMILNGDFDINAPDNKGGTAIIYACFNGYAGLLKILLERGGDPTASNDMGFNALHVSAMHGSALCTRILLRSGVDFAAVDGGAGAAALHVAAQVGHTCVMVELIVAGADVNQRATTGETPLFLAATRGQFDAVKLLLDAQADTTLKCDDHSALEVAVKFQHPAIVREIRDHSEVQGDQRALTYAAGLKNMEILGILCDGGVKDLGGKALCAAISAGLEESVKFLIQKVPEAAVKKYVVSARSGVKFSPLECCFSSLKPFTCRIVRRLLDAGVNTGGIFDGHDPASFVTFLLDMKRDGDDDKVHALEGIRRVCLQEVAVHAMSWRWKAPSDSSDKRVKLRLGLPIPVQRSTRSRRSFVLLRAISRPKVDAPFLGYDL